MLACIGTEWKPLTWIRYSIWIPLYPLGVLAEGTFRLMRERILKSSRWLLMTERLCLFPAVAVIQSLPIFDETRRFSFPLPAVLGGSLSFSCPLQLYLVLMFLGKTVLNRLNGYFQCFIIWGAKVCFHRSLWTLWCIRDTAVLRLFNASNISLSELHLY